jgi:hypothetical protein
MILYVLCIMLLSTVIQLHHCVLLSLRAIVVLTKSEVTFYHVILLL